MFDSFRDSKENDAFAFQDDDVQQDDSFDGQSKKSKKKSSGGGNGLGFNSKNFMGMNAIQRFIISIMFFMMVCILGAMFLLITGSLYLPL